MVETSQVCISLPPFHPPILLLSFFFHRCWSQVTFALPTLFQCLFLGGLKQHISGAPLLLLLFASLFSDGLSKVLVSASSHFTPHCFILHVFCFPLTLVKKTKSLSQFICLPSLQVCVSLLCRDLHLGVLQVSQTCAKKTSSNPNTYALVQNNRPPVFSVLGSGV